MTIFEHVDFTKTSSYIKTSRNYRFKLIFEFAETVFTKKSIATFWTNIMFLVFWNKNLKKLPIYDEAIGHKASSLTQQEIAILGRKRNCHVWTKNVAGS